MNVAQPTTPGGYTPGAGLPLGVPAASGDEAVSAQVGDEFPGSREPNTSSSSSSEAPPRGAGRRVGARQLARLTDQLSDRDHAVLQLVADHRYLTTHQIQRFCFVDHETAATGARVARRVLARLQRDGLIRSLDRRVGGLGSGSGVTIWRLSASGLRIVYGDDKRRRSGEPSERFLRHCLAIADVHVLLHQHRRIEAIENVVVEVEPASWRKYLGPSGEPRWLQPDLYTEITTADFVDRTFIEVDLGTESLPTLIRKCQQYEDYRRSGTEQDRAGSFPLVVWLLTTAERAAKLEATVHRSHSLTAAMFRYATPNTLAQVLAGGAA